MMIASLNPAKNKLCKKCLSEKPVSEFYLKKWQGKKKVYRYYCSPCKDCYTMMNLKWASTNRLKSNSIKYKYKKNNPEKRKETLAKWHLKRRAMRPWETVYFAAKQRCDNPKQRHFKYYGGKGIKCLMSVEDFEFLWKRDNASELARPSIDRIDSGKNYEISNCRFIELSENSRRATKHNQYTVK